MSDNSNKFIMKDFKKFKCNKENSYEIQESLLSEGYKWNEYCLQFVDSNNLIDIHKILSERYGNYFNGEFYIFGNRLGEIVFDAFEIYTDEGYINSEENLTAMFTEEFNRGSLKLNKYLVALRVGGVMELPEISYMNFEVIEAISAEKAEEIYNKKHDCSYFYAECLAEKVEGVINILNKNVTYAQVEVLNEK